MFQTIKIFGLIIGLKYENLFFLKKNFSNEKFRKIKRKNWQGFYPCCKKCESISMKKRYEKNPIPQMLSNAKIRAK